jgi:hypothetical protein
MDWQQIVSLLIVALSAALLVRRQLRKRRRAAMSPCGRGADCGCSIPSHVSYSEKITYKFVDTSAEKKKSG